VRVGVKVAVAVGEGRGVGVRVRVGVGGSGVGEAVSVGGRGVSVAVGWVVGVETWGVSLGFIGAGARVGVPQPANSARKRKIRIDRIPRYGFFCIAFSSRFASPGTGANQVRSFSRLAAFEWPDEPAKTSFPN
jgi:hypothetical protein